MSTHIHVPRFSLKAVYLSSRHSCNSSRLRLPAAPFLFSYNCTEMSQPPNHNHSSLVILKHVNNHIVINLTIHLFLINCISDCKIWVFAYKSFSLPVKLMKIEELLSIRATAFVSAVYTVASIESGNKCVFRKTYVSKTMVPSSTQSAIVIEKWSLIILWV